jgi:hypothetical protein
LTICGLVSRTVSWWLAKAADTLLTLVVRAMSVGSAEADDVAREPVAFQGFSRRRHAPRCAGKRSRIMMIRDRPGAQAVSRRKNTMFRP